MKDEDFKTMVSKAIREGHNAGVESSIITLKMCALTGMSLENGIRVLEETLKEKQKLEAFAKQVVVIEEDASEEINLN